MESNRAMTIDQKSAILQQIKEANARKGPPDRPLTEEERAVSDRNSRIGTIIGLKELGVRVESDKEGNIAKVIEVPSDYRPSNPNVIEKTARQRRRERIMANIDPNKMSVDLDAIMKDLNPPARRGEGAQIGKGNTIRKEWRKLHPPRWRPTKGRLQKSLAKAA